MRRLRCRCQNLFRRPPLKQFADFPCQLLQNRRLLAELTRALRAFFGVYGRGSDGEVHLVGRFIHLRDSLVLLLGCRSYRISQFVQLPSGNRNCIQLLRNLARYGNPLLAGAHRFPDLLRSLLRRRGAALGQTPHLVGHHCESHARLSGASCFHRGVQRQYIGLEGDFVDQLVDLNNIRSG